MAWNTWGRSKTNGRNLCLGSQADDFVGPQQGHVGYNCASLGQHRDIEATVGAIQQFDTAGEERGQIARPFHGNTTLLLKTVLDEDSSRSLVELHQRGGTGRKHIVCHADEVGQAVAVGVKGRNGFAVPTSSPYGEENGAQLSNSAVAIGNSPKTRSNDMVSEDRAELRKKIGTDSS